MALQEHVGVTSIPETVAAFAGGRIAILLGGINGETIAVSPGSGW